MASLHGKKPNQSTKWRTKKEVRVIVIVIVIVPTFSRAGRRCLICCVSLFTLRFLDTSACVLCRASLSLTSARSSLLRLMVVSRRLYTTGRVRRKCACAWSLLRPATTSRRPGNGSRVRATSTFLLANLTRSEHSCTADFVPCSSTGHAPTTLGLHDTRCSSAYEDPLWNSPRSCRNHLLWMSSAEEGRSDSTWTADFVPLLHDVAPTDSTFPPPRCEVSDLVLVTSMLHALTSTNRTTATSSSSSWAVVAASDVVLETKVLVSRRLEDKKIKSWSWSWSWSWQKSLENFQDFYGFD